MAIGGQGSGGDFSEINITPLTDVFLILFLLMIVIAPLLRESALQITPPKAQYGKASSTSGKVINVEIDQSGIIAINGKKLQEEPMEAENVATTVVEYIGNLIESDEAYKEAPLNVVADAETKQKYVVGVLDAAAGLEITKLNIVTVSGS